LAGRRAAIDGYIAYVPKGLEPLFDGHLADRTGLVLADGSPEMPAMVQGFGRCLLHAVRSLLDDGYGAVCVLNSDSPTLPTSILVRTAEILAGPGDRAVLGPAEDGGYYVLGLKAEHAHMFADIAWSTDSVAARTRQRAAEIGLALVELPAWYDVDDAASLYRLIDELNDAAPVDDGLVPFKAPCTAARLAAIGFADAAAVKKRA
jgi:hypothetical protein